MKGHLTDKELNTQGNEQFTKICTKQN